MQLRTGLPKHLARQEGKRTTPPRAVGREGEWLRLGKGIDRRDCGFLQEVNYNVPANSPVMLIPVPQKEREANKAVKDGDYNPLGSKPQPVPLNN